MRSVTADNISDTFLGYFGDETDPRVKELMGSLAKHLHDFVKETKLTHDEWRKALELLKWTGDITTPERNEFVLLSDVLGISSLVDMINSSPDATSSSVLGPFHVTGAPPMDLGADFKRDYDGEVVLVEGFVKDTTGKALAGATVDIWQTAPNGLYSSQDEEQDIHSFHGMFTTDQEGRYSFTTVRPVSYTVPSDGPVGVLLNATGRHPWRPSHLHYIVSMPGYQSLVTEVFPNDDPYLDQDTVFGVREDLVIAYQPQAAGTFPKQGFELSGKVSDAFTKIEFDAILKPI
ncbi:hydroxyquinol 1,2-dioxygenase [Alginatibacterium sediminis]|uniref:Hydroxyquinol 1,2-dioxygenase n=1 Tax=Alginatibacterium sediminis TaxID=2164068 RepID=A0A420E6X7_9ALTE|nr:dioxygenase [Alginatibacterium sediminis]RKF14367.1 hydroxyquinol 1,2-dioxygenase [Alginatibacterium sediminis]